MPLETGTYISDLVTSNPVGTDTIDKADDHLRLIKSTVKNTFPNISGAVTTTHTDLNKLTSTGSPQFATIELGNATDTTLARSAAGVLSVQGVAVPLNSTTNTHTAQQIELGHASDTTITRVSAGLIAVEGSNVPLEDRANTFTAAQTISQGASGANLNLTGDAATIRAVNFRTAGTFRWIVMAHSVAESGSNAGSDFKIRRYSDAGANLGDSINISRATGLTTLEALTVTGDITANGDCLVKTTGGLGYGSGSGGTVTQLTSKATGVTLNKTNGAITTAADALAASTTVSFTFTNSTLAGTDSIIVHRQSGGSANSYNIWCDNIVAGSCTFSIRNITGGSLSEAVVLRFSVIKAVNS